MCLWWRGVEGRRVGVVIRRIRFPAARRRWTSRRRRGQTDATTAATRKASSQAKGQWTMAPYNDGHQQQSMTATKSSSSPAVVRHAGHVPPANASSVLCPLHADVTIFRDDTAHLRL